MRCSPGIWCRRTGCGRLAPARADRGPGARRVRPVLLDLRPDRQPRPGQLRTGTLDRARLERLRRGGVAPIGDEDGRALFDTALRSGLPAAAPVRLDPAALRAAAARGELPAVLTGLAPAGARAAAAAPDGPSIERIRALPAEQRPAAVLELVRANVAAVLGHASADAVDAQQAFKDTGFDSLTAVQLRNRLNAATGLRLPATLVFDHPTPGALAEHLGAELLPAEATPADLVLDRLAALERALPAEAADGPTRARVAARLEAVLARWRGPVEGPADGIEDASTDELLAFIDNQLGRSAG
nr:acyl carrier protein [Kitasatospora phosalacinea]